MTPHAFLSALENRGVSLVLDSAAPSGVKSIAPPSVVTANLAAEIRTMLPQLLPVLQERGPLLVPTRAIPGHHGIGVTPDIPPPVEPENAVPLPVPLAESDSMVQLRKLAAEMEADWDRQEWDRLDTESLLWWDYWRRVLLILECLPPIEWKMKQGVTVPNLAVWLRLTLGRCRVHERLDGVGWFYSPFGQGIRPDFDRLSALLVTDSVLE